MKITFDTNSVEELQEVQALVKRLLEKQDSSYEAVPTTAWDAMPMQAPQNETPSNQSGLFGMFESQVQNDAPVQDEESKETKPHGIEIVDF